MCCNRLCNNWQSYRGCWKSSTELPQTVVISGCCLVLGLFSLCLTFLEPITLTSCWKIEEVRTLPATAGDHPSCSAGGQTLWAEQTFEKWEELYLGVFLLLGDRPGCVLIELLGERWQWGAHGKDAELVPDSLVKLHRGSMAGIHLHSVRSLAYLKWDRESSMLGLWSLCCFSSLFILRQNKVVVSQGNLPFNLA